METVVTGASRGIGLEFVRQLAARGDVVHAAARNPQASSGLRELAASRDGERIHVHSLDVADGAGVTAFAAQLGDQPIDLLINCAGVYGGSRQSLGADFDFDDAVRTFEVNALGPLRVVIALLANLKRANAARIVHVTSGMASIEDNTSGGFYSYRMSKTALNMASRSMAADLRGAGIASAVINPGWVQTDMGGPSAPTTVGDSIRGMLEQIDTLTVDSTGSFLDWRGRPRSW